MRLNSFPSAALCTVAFLGAPIAAKDLFGTINGLGQHAEHEKITRAALQCKGSWNPECFEVMSMDQLAGKPGALFRLGTFGAVGSPDVPPPFGGEAHCDDADFLNITGYPQSRQAATENLQKCVTFMKGSFKDGINKAVDLLDGSGNIKGSRFYDFRSPYPDCTFRPQSNGRAKCNVFQGFGVALHGVQDFYSHSNWVDHAEPPYKITNPPGLANTVPAPLLALQPSAPPISVPFGLSTGCYQLGYDTAPAPKGKMCYNRILHDSMNKDKGIIDPSSGRVSQAGTDRGQLNDNFQRAVSLAIMDTKRQWKDFRAELTATYGQSKATKMICVIARDRPWSTC